MTNKQRSAQKVVWLLNLKSDDLKKKSCIIATVEKLLATVFIKPFGRLFPYIPPSLDCYPRE